MTQASMQARYPAAPVSAAYSLDEPRSRQLKYLFDLIKRRDDGAGRHAF